MNEGQIVQCIHDFFNIDHVRKAMVTIEKCKISGWEGWLQVEFAHYLETKVYGTEQGRKEFDWYREYKIITKSPDCNGSDEKHRYIIPDFWISSDKGTDTYFLIEFKRSNAGDVASHMSEDVKKWQAHIDCYEDALECASEPGKAYKNLGVFFVGVDTKQPDLVALVQDVTLELRDESPNYLIWFMPTANMVST